MYVKGLEIEEHKDKKSKACSGGTKRKLSYILSMLGKCCWRYDEAEARYLVVIFKKGKDYRDMGCILIAVLLSKTIKMYFE